MKNTKLITLFTALFVGIVMISCGRYEEGPGFSLLPKKTRLQQNWKPVQTVDANGNINNLDDSYIGDTWNNFKDFDDSRYFNSTGVDCSTDTLPGYGF